MKLIGANTWNPVGESLWSIVSHLSQQNYLNWVEIRRLFGVKNLRSFATDAGQDPDKPENFALPRLTVLTGWKPSKLSASFSDWYQPPWLAKDERSPLRRQSDYLRICPDCVKQGSHLVMHQLLDWVRCPIHNAPLTSRCPNCHNVLGRFRITRELERIGGRCQHCAHHVLSDRSPPEHQRAKVRMLSDYDAWLRIIQSSFERDTGHYQWLGPKGTTSTLPFLDKLLPGPTFVSKSMAYADDVNLTTWRWHGDPVSDGKNLRIYRIEKDPIHLRYNRGGSRIKLPGVVDDFSRFLINAVQQERDRLVNTFDLSSFHSGIQEWNAQECTPQFGESVDAWGSGYWLWRRSLDEAFPYRTRWARTYQHEPLQMSWLWEDWVSSVGQLTWSPHRSLAEPQNVAYVRWLTRRWLTRVCDESYAMFVGAACRRVGDSWLNTHWLKAAILDVARPSLWVRETRGSDAGAVHALSAIAPIARFVALKDASAHLLDDNFLQSFAPQGALIELLGTHPQDRHLWEVHWRALKRHYKKRSSGVIPLRKASPSDMHKLFSTIMDDAPPRASNSK